MKPNKIKTRVSSVSIALALILIATSMTTFTATVEAQDVVVEPSEIDLTIAGAVKAIQDRPVGFDGRLIHSAPFVLVDTGPPVGLEVSTNLPDLGVPFTDVEILHNGEVVTTTTTDMNGEYAVELEFSDLGMAELTAVAYRGTPEEVESETWVVNVVHPDMAMVKIAGGNSRTCATLAEGTAVCWGLNSSGQLGDGTDEDRNAPVSVNNLSDIVDISAGADHTCALLSNGTMSCWGANWFGMLGDGTTTDRWTPVQVPGLFDVVAISAGHYHTCALTSDGTAHCWGWNLQGRLGDGTDTDRHTPVQVHGLSDIVTISAGQHHTCAVIADGTPYCWGTGGVGQLGDGSGEDHWTPVQVADLVDVASISGGGQWTCATKTDGTAWCWGYNHQGYLGDGTTTTRQTPVRVADPSQVGFISDVATVEAGLVHTCAITTDGTAYCWGDGRWGNIGDGGFYWGARYPVEVVDLTNVNEIDPGNAHTCTVESDGLAYCWGSNHYGQLGIGEFRGGGPCRCFPTAQQVV